MSCIAIPNGILSVGGPDYAIDVGGKRLRFEMHSYCGPVLLNARGDPASRTPVAFWDAVTAWTAQGTKLVDGIAQWDPVAWEKSKAQDARDTMLAEDLALDMQRRSLERAERVARRRRPR